MQAIVLSPNHLRWDSGFALIASSFATVKPALLVRFFPARLEGIENAPSYLAIVATGDNFPQRDIAWFPALGFQTGFRPSGRRRRHCRSYRTTRVQGNYQRR